MCQETLEHPQRHHSNYQRRTQEQVVLLSAIAQSKSTKQLLNTQLNFLLRHLQHMLLQGRRRHKKYKQYSLPI